MLYKYLEIVADLKCLSKPRSWQGQGPFTRQIIVVMQGTHLLIPLIFLIFNLIFFYSEWDVKHKLSPSALICSDARFLKRKYFLLARFYVSADWVFLCYYPEAFELEVFNSNFAFGIVAFQ